ncbi:MAG TPA: hypothetical protein ENK28_11640 [Aliiroseovarius sp.]|nr:hypothetical protein [Aliiroseovarius sp.]
MACPNYNLYGDTYELTGRSMYNTQSVNVRAGGDQSITGCGIRFGSDRGRGYVTQAPDFSLKLSGMGGYKLSVSVVSKCDSILLINTGAANWFYDDDDNGNLDAKIVLTRPSNGWLDIWVGTHDGSVCDATLYLETFRR